MVRSPFSLAARSLVLLALLSAPDAGAQQVSATPVEVIVPAAPTPVPAVGRTHLVYEVHLTNFGAKTLQLREVEAVDADVPGAVLGHWRGEALAARTLLVGSGTLPQETALTLPAGRRAILHLWLTVPSGRPTPRALGHRLHFGARLGEAATLTPPNVPVERRLPSTLAAPHGPGTWAAVRGPSNTSGHRLGTLALNGTVYTAQRFAVDWVKLGADGRFFAGSGQRVEDWYGFGQPVLATAGRVVFVRDGVPDRAPLHLEAEAQIVAADAPGNTVVINLGAGRFAVYAHLRRGSVTVRVGDTVRDGQRIGHVGNSGNSLAPHLHVHVADAPDPLAAQGVPFVLSRFTLLGQLTAVLPMLRGEAWKADASRPARVVQREVPLENMIVSF